MGIVIANLPGRVMGTKISAMAPSDKLPHSGGNSSTSDRKALRVLPPAAGAQTPSRAAHNSDWGDLGPTGLLKGQNQIPVETGRTGSDHSESTCEPNTRLVPW